ncbi:MAG: hypothetical protein ACLVCH_12775 [Roseburia inulinivorans]
MALWSRDAKLAYQDGAQSPAWFYVNLCKKPAEKICKKYYDIFNK